MWNFRGINFDRADNKHGLVSFSKMLSEFKTYSQYKHLLRYSC